MTWNAHKDHSKWSRYSKVRRLGYHRVRTTAWARPYAEPIETIDTGRDKQWRYSPRFTTCEANVFIELTGRRSKDYKIAEMQCGKVHVPRKTVWHHVWNEINGKYEIQLVDYRLHQSTCPHAGGCKLWLLRHTDRKRYARKERTTRNIEISMSEYFLSQNIRLERINSTGYRRNYYLSYRTANSQKEKDYHDIVLDYKFPEDNSFQYRKYALNDRNSFNLRKWGLDPYGNLFYRDGKGCLYFYDHEEMSLTPLNIRDVSNIR